MSSAGQIVGGIVGAVVGFYVGGPQGAVMGAQVGMGVGGYIDPPKGPTINGPRLSDLSAQTSTYGSPIPRIYGTVATHGNVIWLQGNKLTERVRKEKQGGKGGGGGATVKTYSYYATFAVGLADVSKTGPIQGVRRIWVGGNLIYDAGSDDLETIIASNQAAKGFRVYFGDEDQMPDPRMQADLGVADCPAYRGLSYIVFYDFALKDYGNSLMAAQVKVEIVDEANFGPIARVDKSDNFTSPLYTSSMPRVSDDGVASVFLGKSSSTCRFVERTLHNQVIPRGIVSFFAEIQPTQTAADVDIFIGTNSARDSIIEYSSKGAILRRAFLNRQYTNNSTYHRRDGRSYFLDRSGITTSYLSEIAGLVATDIMTTISSTGVMHDICLGDDYDYAIFCASGSTSVLGRVKCYEKGFSSEVWSVDVSSLSLAADQSSGADRCVARPDPSGGVILRSFRTFVKVTSSGFESLGTISTPGMDVSYDSRGGECYVGGLWHMLIHDPIGSSAAWIQRIRLSTRLNNVKAELADIVSDECLQSGLLSGSDIDVTGLDQEVRGYRIAQTGAIRGALEPLQGAWPCDVIQAGYKIKFVRRGKTPIATIDASELDARQADSGPGVQITLANEMDTQLPRAVSLKYLDIGREYDLSEQNAERLNTDAVNLREMEMPIVLSATEAAGMSEVLLYLYWLERRDVSFRLPPEYRYLEPADVITVTGEWGQYELRLTRINLESDGRLECYAKFNAAAIYTPTAQGAEGEAPAQTIPLDGPSQYIMLDVPLLSDSYNSPGWPAAMAGYTSGWPGGVIYRSVDGGQTWADLQGFTSPVTMGYARGALGAGRFDIVDASGVLDVDMMAGDLSSIDEVAQFAGGNALAYGAPGRWEICSPRTVTLNADGSLRMTDWLRGRFGTEWAASLHQSGDALVLLTDPDLAWVSMESGAIGLPRDYRGITSGRAIDTDTSRIETYSGVNLKPLSPVYLKGHITPGTLDWTLTWTRRGRVSPEWRNSVDVPIGETSESYQVEIYDGPSYATVKRTLTASTPAVAYTSAQQVTDFGAHQKTIYARVYQMSAEVGRGYPLSGSIYCAVGPAPYLSSVQFSGTFATGIEVQFRIGPILIGSHITVSGDVDLSGVAAAMAASVNGGSTAYSASASGDVVNVTAAPGSRPPVSVSISGSSALSSIFVQSAAVAGPGSAYYAQYFVSNFMTGETEPIPSGTTFTLVFQRPAGNTLGAVSYTTSIESTRSDVYTGLASQPSVQPGGSLHALGYRLGASGDVSGPFGYIIGPTGETGHNVSGGAASGQFNLSVSVQDPGSSAVATDRVQIVEYTVSGTPTVEEQFSIVLQGVTFSFTASTASASDVAAGLASAVDASPAYTASASGAVVTISGMGASQSYTYSSQILCAIRASNI